MRTVTEAYRDASSVPAEQESGGGASFIRGLIIGGVLALGASLVVGDLVRRKSVVITNTERGEIRISRDALEGLIKERCEAIAGVLAVRSKARKRGDRTLLHVSVTLAPTVEAGPTVGRVLDTVYGEMERILNLHPEQVPLTIETIRVQAESEAALSLCPDDERE